VSHSQANRFLKDLPKHVHLIEGIKVLGLRRGISVITYWKRWRSQKENKYCLIGGSIFVD